MQEKRWINRKFRGTHLRRASGVEPPLWQEALRLRASFQIGTLGDLNAKNLAAAIVAAGRTGDVSTDTATALRTLGELRRMPAVCRFASTQAHLGGLSFRNAHGL
jgi:UDP-N-acetylmuramyl pentapeptide synthase